MTSPTGSFDADGSLDPSDGRIVVAVGKKKTGKSKMGLLFFMEYPGDKIVIDVAGDDGPRGGDVIELRGSVDELPTKLPEHLRRNDPATGRPLPMTFRYVPDPGSATFHEDMDHVLGLALTHGDCAVLVHEAGVVFRNGKVGPHGRRALQHNRHHRVTLILCMPRTLTVDPLVIGQADLIYLFRLPQEQDRERVALTIGWPVQDFHAACDRVRGHGHLRYDDNMPEPATDDDPDYRLILVPPLPEDVIAEIERYSDQRPPKGGERDGEADAAWLAEHRGHGR